jgi:hypothetical protein
MRHPENTEALGEIQDLLQWLRYRLDVAADLHMDQVVLV